MARGGVTQEVELLDDDAEASRPARPSLDAVRAAGGAGAGRRRSCWSLVGAQWVVDAREDAAVARLAAVPGVLAPLGDELEVVRALDEEESRPCWARSRCADGTTANLRVGEDGSQAFTATELRTGEVVWSTPLLGPNAARAAGRLSSSAAGASRSPRRDGRADVGRVHGHRRLRRILVAGRRQRSPRRSPGSRCSTPTTGT